MNARRYFRTAVSLHSHTEHSLENLGFIPRLSRKVPILSQMVDRQLARYEEVHGTRLDLRRAWWTPPLSAKLAYELERTQIETELARYALVSLSDHDDIEAGSSLQVIYPTVPISVEWTVPVGSGGSFFHIGVHNLPANRARALWANMQECANSGLADKVTQALALLNESQETLIVFNHPFWDEAEIGAATHAQLVETFLRRNSTFIHAFELNGLRPIQENKAVENLADAWGLPVISGGDRHGCEPNSVVNYTNAAVFEEFVEEIRRDRRSFVVYLPHYSEPMRYRILQNLGDIMKDYDNLPEGRRRWTDRVYYEANDGTVRSLSTVWRGEGPFVVRAFASGVRLLGAPTFRGVARSALALRRETS